MITEELKVKITADSSDLKSEVSQVKKDLSTIGNSEGTTKLTSGLGQSADAAEQLSAQLSSIKNMSFAGLLSNVSNLSDQFKTFKSVKQDFKEMADYATQFLDKNSEIYTGDNAILDWEGKAEAQKNYNAHMSEANSIISEGTGVFGLLAQKVGSAGVAVGAIVASLAALAAELLVVVSLVKNAFTIASQVKEINSEAKKIGLSTQAYQEWGYVLEQCGVETDKLTDFVKTLTEEQIAARNGSEDTIAAFQALGLSMEEVSAMSQEELFTKTVEGLQNISDEGYRTHLAYTLLGEDAAQLNNVLYLNNEETARLITNYNLLGGVASQRLVERSEALQSSLNNMKGAWQGVKNTLAEAVLPAITAVVNALTKAIAIVNIFLKTVLGIDFEASRGTSSGGYLGGATSGVDNYTNSTEAATTATEKLKRTLMGFDELNVVSNPNSSSSSSSSPDDYSGGDYGVSGGDYGINSEDLGLTGLQEWFSKYKTIIQDITTWSLIGIGVVGTVLCLIGGNWVGALAFASMAGIGLAVGSVEGGTFDRLGAKIKTWWSGVKTWFNTSVKPVFTKEYWQKKWDNLKSAASDKLGEIKKAIDNKIKPIKTWFNNSIKPVFTKKYWTDKWDKVKSAASEKLGDIKKAIDNKMKPLKNWLDNKIKPVFTKKYWQEKWDKIKDAAGTKITEMKKTIDNKMKPLKNWFDNKIKTIFTKKYWQDKWDKIKSAAGDKLATFKKLFDDKLKSLRNWFNNTLKPIFTKKYWIDKFDKVKEGIADKVGQYKTKIDEKLKPLKTWFNNTLKPIFTLTYWKNKFDTIRAGAVDKLGAAKTAINTKWGDIKKWFDTNVKSKFALTYWKNKFDTIRSAAASKVGDVKTAFSTGWGNVKTWWNNNVASKFTTTYWTDKFACIKNGAKAAFNGIISAVEGAVNNIINKINTLSWKVPDWVPKIGGNTWGFNFSTIYIPRLAKGGIATSSTLANIGEAGAEAVLPLENNTGWMDILADKIAARSGQAPSKIVLQVGEKELGWATIRSINQITQQTGGLQLKL